MKKFLITLLLIAIPSFVLAVPTSVDRVTNFIQPLIRSDFIKATYFTATSTSQASTFPYASSTAVTVSGRLYNTSLSDGCLNVTTGLIGSTGVACGAGSSISPWATTTSTVSGRPVLYPIDDTYIATVGSNSTTTAEFYFDPNLNIATIGANPSFLGGKVYTNGIFSTPTQLMLTDSVNDLQSNMVIGNTYSAGDGYYATGGITFVNGRSTQGTSFQTSNYYTYMGLSGPNFVAFTGLPPNGFVINNTDGPIVYGATSANIASSTQCWAIGSGFAVANYDMCLKNVDTAGSSNTASGGLGIGTTTPKSRLALAASSTATFDYFTVYKHTNGVYDPAPVFSVNKNENIGIGILTPLAPLHVYSDGTTNTTLPGFLFTRSDTTNQTHLQHYFAGINYMSQNLYRDVSGVWDLDKDTDPGVAIISDTRAGQGYISFWTAPPTVGLLTPTERFRMTSVGRFGLATTTPNNLFDIYSTTKAALGFSGASGNNYKWTIGMDVTNAGRFSIASSTALGTTDRLVIDGAGKVGIGTTSPATILHVTSGANATSTATIGELGLSTSKACVNMNRSDGGAGSFYLNSAGVIVSEANYCR